MEARITTRGRRKDISEVHGFQNFNFKQTETGSVLPKKARLRY